MSELSELDSGYIKSDPRISLKKGGIWGLFSSIVALAATFGAAKIVEKNPELASQQAELQDAMVGVVAAVPLIVGSVVGVVKGLVNYLKPHRG